MSKKPLSELPPERTQAELAEMAGYIIGQRVIHNEMLPANLVGSVFMPIAFGALAGYTTPQLKKLLVLAVEGVHKAVPARSINGWPIFVEFQLWRRACFIKVLDLADKARTVLTGPEDGGA